MFDIACRSHHWRRLATFLTAAALGACASTRDSGPPRTGEEPDESIAGYPYSRNQLREAFVVGTRITLRFEDHGKLHYEDLEVVAADRDLCTISTKVVSEQGDLIEDQGTRSQTWQELQARASHPLDETVISEGSIKSFVGEIETWLYVHTTEDAEGREVQAYHHYAKTLPGPPVLETVLVDGELVKRVAMVGRR